MTLHFRKCLIAMLFLGVTSAWTILCSGEEPTVEKLAHSIETIDVESAKPFPLHEQAVRNDSGINVLVDHAHRATFKMMWTCPRMLRANGFRAVGSQASLNTVLPEGSLCRVRVPIEGRYPFAWREAPEFNVVMTLPGAHQAYLPSEQDAVEAFIRNGGGLVVLADLNTPLLKRYGCTAPEVSVRRGAKRSPVVLDDNWEVLESPEQGDSAFSARRTYGKGRIFITTSEPYDPSADESRREAFFDNLRWVSEGRDPVGGTLRLPQERGGGGPIYPELEERFGPIVVYYAKNQREDLIETVRETLPEVRSTLFEWLPSVEPPDPMYIVLSAGGGGGWAVNAYLPKETGIISASRTGIISIFAHEQAHTMAGPPNEDGEMAGQIPFGNRGEAHAGWFQGKIDVFFGYGNGKNINGILAREDREGEMLDLARMDDRAYAEKWGKGADWSKLWWVFAQLDARYGTTWYPRWKWVQYTRWADEPNRRLSWDDIAEDMSIAVGEDLFPFLRSVGTTLEKERLETIEFNGETLELPVAPLKRESVERTLVDPIGDYKQPLTPKP